MKIDKQYGIWWETTTKLIQNEYTQIIYGLELYEANMMVEIEPGMFVNCTTYYYADTLEEIENKIIEEKLIRYTNENSII